MTRDISTTLLTALNADTVSVYYAVELFFDSGTVRLWTGIGNKSISGNVYTGTGSLLSISAIEETSDLGAKNATIMLSGIDSAIVSIALTEPYQGRNCKIYLGVDGITDVVTLFSGIMDVMTIEDSGETSTIVLTVESKIISLDRVVPLRYTEEVQQAKWPSDTFFSYVAKLQDKPIYWGRETPRRKS